MSRIHCRLTAEASDQLVVEDLKSTNGTKVNGKDVTSSVTRTSSFVTYTSGVPLPDGQVNVTVAVADFAGNEASRSWTFTIQTR